MVWFKKTAWREGALRNLLGACGSIVGPLAEESYSGSWHAQPWGPHNPHGCSATPWYRFWTPEGPWTKGRGPAATIWAPSRQPVLEGEVWVWRVKPGMAAESESYRSGGSGRPRRGGVKWRGLVPVVVWCYFDGWLFAHTGHSTPPRGGWSEGEPRRLRLHGAERWRGGALLRPRPDIEQDKCSPA